MVSIIFFILAAICNAVMDKINFHWDESIFKGSRFEQWANPAVSYRNKWKNHVWTTDLWHFAQSFMISFFILGGLFYEGGLVTVFEPFWVNTLIDFILFKLVFSLTFELFWSTVLEKR
jgi:hypothetical protein